MKELIGIEFDIDALKLKYPEDIEHISYKRVVLKSIEKGKMPAVEKTHWSIVNSEGVNESITLDSYDSLFAFPWYIRQIYKREKSKKVTVIR